MIDSIDTYLAVGAVIFMIFMLLICLSCNISNIVYVDDYVEVD
jgi:hypothetical protein